jgi:hypothetical protein
MKSPTTLSAARILRAAIILASLLPNGAFAESIVKKKDGQTLRGTIKGYVVQRGEDVGAAGTRTISYNVIPGEAVATIDERGINLTTGKTLRVVVVRQAEMKSDQFNLEFAGDFLTMSFDVNMEVAGVGPMAVRTFEGKDLRDTIIGRLEKAGDKMRLSPEIGVETAAGLVLVPINTIVAFSKPGPGAAASVTAPAAGETSPDLRIEKLEVLQAKGVDAYVQFAVTVFDAKGDVNLERVAGRAYVFCGNEAFALSLGAPDKVIRKSKTTNTIWISNGQPGVRVAGSCQLSVFVQGRSGNKSAEMKVPVEFETKEPIAGRR